MLLIPGAVSCYYARSNLKKFIHWIFIGGMTPVMISRITQRNLFSLRNFIPTTFLVTIIILLLSSFFSPVFLSFLGAMLGLYLSVAIFFSISIVKKEGNPIYFFSMSFVFFLTHIAYGAGFLAGFTSKLTKDPCV